MWCRLYYAGGFVRFPKSTYLVGTVRFELTQAKPTGLQSATHSPTWSCAHIHCRHYTQYNVYCKRYRLHHFRSLQLGTLYNPNFSSHKRDFILEPAHSPQCFLQCGDRISFPECFTLSKHWTSTLLEPIKKPLSFLCGFF